MCPSFWKAGRCFQDVAVLRGAGRGGAEGAAAPPVFFCGQL